MKIIFLMSCGHVEERECADPKKYLKIDRDYYRKQGLCSTCWAKLHDQQRCSSRKRIKEGGDLMDEL